jgi:hypothetical protein
MTDAPVSMLARLLDALSRQALPVPEDAAWMAEAIEATIAKGGMLEQRLGLAPGWRLALKAKRRIDNIIETPLFVDSRLTRMVQIADLCSYH